jgi:hypothetical protein
MFRRAAPIVIILCPFRAVRFAPLLLFPTGCTRRYHITPFQGCSFCAFAFFFDGLHPSLSYYALSGLFVLRLCFCSRRAAPVVIILCPFRAVLTLNACHVLALKGRYTVTMGAAHLKINTILQLALKGRHTFTWVVPISITIIAHKFFR